ncbi:menin-like [Saccostrea echinata]|uniref:menin-like n=1 Tax=Saccostrea echinata TaxID=191078 RepID=UPI002A7EB17D|nr:menin-like [Saccostrea echinata]
MAGFRDREKQFFPLQNIQDVVKLFRDQLTCGEEPNLSLLSIVLGVIENILTVNRAVPTEVDNSSNLEPIFPVVELHTIEALYSKFETHIKRSVDLTRFPGNHATRELVKHVSDVIWGSLTRSFYKDKAHLQSLYSFLTGNKLDCFGVAFGVVAAFQILGYKDVHLALSEDHAWVVFGEDLAETAEVTWHGKGNEDKRGQPITAGTSEKSWLYLNGHPVICTRQMEVSSIVSGINPSITATMDSVELGSLQQELLWLLYDLGHLKKYPMALGNLGDLEEISPTENRQKPIELFHEAIASSQEFYNDQHVYPYTYLGGYLYRKQDYHGALQAWADAASVIKKYNYSREDEEIYKEFLEIANDLIPSMMKHVAGENAARIHHTSLLYSPESYANFLRFYDGICEWEEDSPTPVLHITWAKQLVFSISKFDTSVRVGVDLKGENGDEDESEDSDDEDNNSGETKDKNQNVKEESSRNRTEESDMEGGVPTGKGRGGRPGKRRTISTVSKTSTVNGNSEEDKIKSAIQELESKVGGEENEKEDINPNIPDLAKACSESILNPEFLLGGGEPFTTATTTTSVTTSTSEASSRGDLDDFLSSKSNGSPFMGMTVDSMLKAESPSDMIMFRKRPPSALTHTPSPLLENREGQSETIIPSPTPNEQGPPVILCLRSQKMKGLKKIFSSSKLNASAIKLQLTAQSQVHFKHSKRSTDSDLTTHRKRSRRE